MNSLNIVDLFAGGGGASEGIALGLGVGPAVAINHDPAAITMHAANHPNTLHLCKDVFEVKPFRPGRRPIDLLWGSPDCTHFSSAKGSAPRSNKRRGLAWALVDWARQVTPRVICLENVTEFQGWGPLYSDDYPDPKRRGQPIPERKGETFREFVGALQLAGYRVEWRTLVAADYGAPTSRKRLFMVARCDGEPIGWPEPTHGPGRAHAWRTAAECIDWTLPCPSIFGRRRPLAEATERRIAEGIRRHVFGAEAPYLVDGAYIPSLIQTGYGERDGQAPRVLALDEPLGTVVAGGQKHALLAVFVAKHYGGAVGQGLRRPLGTVTAIDHHSLIGVSLEKFYGTGIGAPLGLPLPTVTATGGHIGLVAAFLDKYYGSETGQHQSCRSPLHTIPTVDRFGVVTVTIDGETYALVDIGLRMLQPRELATAQGFGPDYILTGTKREQVARIGNSVSPPLAAAVAQAQFSGRTRLWEVA